MIFNMFLFSCVHADFGISLLQHSGQILIKDSITQKIPQMGSSPTASQDFSAKLFATKNSAGIVACIFASNVSSRFLLSCHRAEYVLHWLIQSSRTVASKAFKLLQHNATIYKQDILALGMAVRVIMGGSCPHNFQLIGTPI